MRRAAATLVKGTKVGEVYDGQKIFEWPCGGRNAVRTDLAAIRDLRIDTPTGGQVPLGDVADVVIVADAERDQARERVAPDRRDAAT